MPKQVTDLSSDLFVVVVSKNSTSEITCCNLLGKKILQAHQMVADILGIIITVEIVI